MRKKVLALVMGALAISSIGAFAQTQVKEAETVKKECCKKEEGKKCDKKDKKDRKVKKQRANAFEGINLTAEQQQQIDQLRTAQKAKMEASKKESREAKEKQRSEFTAEVEKILTPEQFAQYKANTEKIRTAKKEMKKKNHKGDRKRPAADRPVQPKVKVAE